MGAVGYRSRPHRGRAGCSRGPDAGRCLGGRGALSASPWRDRGHGDLLERVGARDLAELCGGHGLAHVARGCELRTGAGRRRDQPWSGWPCRARGAAWTQRAIRFHRQRRCRCGNGPLRLHIQSGGILSHRGACCSGDPGAYAHSLERLYGLQAGVL